MVIFNVSKSGPTKSIQEAINAAVARIEASDSITEDYKILVDEGTYKGFSIPDGALLPFLGTIYRFSIEASGNFLPIIDFNHSEEGSYIGADIGLGNPNLTISSLRFQFFAVGIRAQANCHELKVKNCILSNNRNVGVYIELSQDVQVIQSVVVNGDYGIVIRACKNSAAVHNTIYLNGQISTTTGVAESALLVSCAPDYGSGSSDTGTAYVIGNILWNTSGKALTLFLDDIERQTVISNYNDIVLGDPYIVIEDRIFYSGSESRPRRSYSTLLDWKRTGLDQNSISADPKFIAPVKTRTGRNVSFLDLNLLANSPVLGLVPAFYNNSVAATTWLPSFVDSADLSRDINGGPRHTVNTSIGANEKASTSGFYGQDVFTDILNNGLVKSCDIDPLQVLISADLSSRFPMFNKGFFFSRDREFYLYANKKAAYLTELAITTFILPEPVVSSKPISLYVNGNKITNPKYVEIDGDILRVKHLDLGIISGEEEVTLQYYGKKWSDNGFSYHSVKVVFRIVDGVTNFYLSEEYVPSSPVVITDDRISYADSDQVANREFSVVFDPIAQKSEIIFSDSSNKILNGQFDSQDNGIPYLWESYLAEVIVSNTSGEFPAYGDYFCRLPVSGYIAQIASTKSGSSCLSWHSRGDGTLFYNIEYYDHNKNQMGFVTTGSVTTTDDWSRYFLVAGVTGDTYSGFLRESEYPIYNLGYNNIPDNPSYVEIKFSTASGQVDIDGVQFEDDVRPSLYHRRIFLNELTVEYESSKEAHYIDYNQSLLPVRNNIVDGFICIPELTADTYNGPKDPSITTLHEWRWPEGRIRHLPWARTLGKDKLVNVPAKKFNLIPTEKTQISVPVLEVAQPKNIILTPSLPICRRGDRLGTGINIKCTDYVGNPMGMSYAWASVSDPRGRYAGLLYKSFYGLKSTLATNVDFYLDSSGGKSLLWLPPNENFGRWIGNVPEPSFVTDSGVSMTFIDVEYPVNDINVGNILIKDSNGDKVPVEGELISQEYIPSYYDNRSIVSLDYMVKQGTIKVWADDKELTETKINSPSSDQFFINYQTSTVYVKGRYAKLFIDYTPIYAYFNIDNPYKIYFMYDKVFSNTTGTITIDYDFTVDLKVDVMIPGTSDFLSKTFKMVVQNPNMYKKSDYNTLAQNI